jgi:hypothetical protein
MFNVNRVETCRKPGCNRLPASRSDYCNNRTYSLFFETPILQVITARLLTSLLLRLLPGIGLREGEAL